MTIKLGKFSDGARKKISDSLHLPSNAILGEPMVEVTGMNQVRVENHKGVVKYASSQVKINTSLATLLITGANLTIKSMIPEEIVITGNIDRVEYLK